MFEGFSQEALEFLLGIRHNNNKDWFEPRKKIYTEKIFEPMKALGEELFAPFADIDGMMYKVGRIYRDENFAPYLHYRDTMWIYVRYDAWYWNKTPTLYFELSPEGAEFGFRISKPEAAVMERFRSQLADDAEPFLNMISELVENYGLTVGGDEYKRKKPCSAPETEELWQKKSLTVHKKLETPEEIFSPELPEKVIDAFRQVMPFNDLFHDLVEIQEAADLLEKAAMEAAAEPAPEIVKAPDTEFMW